MFTTVPTGTLGVGFTAVLIGVPTGLLTGADTGVLTRGLRSTSLNLRGFEALAA